ncbi:MAG: hypothetical protein ACR2OJ_03045 [Hyphomicrobiales bacterium]
MRIFRRFEAMTNFGAIIFVAIVAVFTLSACQTTDIANSIGGATQLASTLDTSADRQRQVALQGESQILKQKKVSGDKALESYLNQITTKMARASGVSDYQYKVRLLEDPRLTRLRPVRVDCS